LLLSIYKKLLQYKDELDEDDRTNLNNLKKELSIVTLRPDGQKEYSPKLILQSQNYNDDDYKCLLLENDIINRAEKHNFIGIRRIYKAYRHFEKLINEYLEDNKAESPTLVESQALLRLAEKFNSAVMVGIEVDSHKDAYMLFESLNHRGMPLSAIDLIKNVLIAEAESGLDTDACYDMWKTALSNVGDDYSVQERFFRQYYNAFRTELNEPFKSTDTSKKFPLAYLATRTTLLDIYEKLIKYDYHKFINDLKRESELYSVIVNNSDKDTIYKGDLLDLDRIQGAPSYLLLLYLLTKQETLKLTDTDIQSVIKLLITFFVRRNITDIPNTRKLNAIFMDMVDTIRDKEGAEVVAIIKSMLMEVSAPEETFEQKLRGPVYDENDTATRFILCAIEAKYQTKEIYTNLWARDNSNKYIWTIEHIFPEGENIPDCWVEMIAGGDRTLANEYRSNYVHTLGNLTITGYNSNLGNKSFEEKKNRHLKSDETKWVGYRNGLHLNADVVSEDTWTVDKIKPRTDRLVAAIKELFKWD